MNFNEITNNASILEAITTLGFTEPSQIQIESIPLINEGRDILAQSQTGTGKTAAFAIPSIDSIDLSIKGTQVLAICPTRELAVQVAGEFSKLLRFCPEISVAKVYGGEHIVGQIKALRKKPQIVVGTPGRLRDHIRRRTLKLDDVTRVILDEADEMLKMGFSEEIEDIYASIPQTTQNIMFSATVPKNVETLAGKYLVNPALVRIAPKQISSDTVEQSYMAVDKMHKKDVVLRIMEMKSPSKCIIFCNTKRMVDELLEYMLENGYKADRLHGDLRQEQRSRVLSSFNKGKIPTLIATDIAGRGIDSKDIDLVINFDLPDEEDSYVHRIGRSGRAGKKGEAVTLATRRDKSKLFGIQRYIKKDIPCVKVPTQKEVNKSKLDRFLSENMTHTQENTSYSEMLESILSEGFTAEEVAIALLKDRLSISGETDDADYNDYGFLKDHGKKKMSGKRPYGNAKGRSYGKKPYSGKNTRNTGKRKPSSKKKHVA